MLTTRQAFDSMREFLRRFNDREPPTERLAIQLLLSWTEFLPDGDTYDPAQWDDWLDAVAAVVDGAPPPSHPRLP